VVLAGMPVTIKRSWPMAHTTMQTSGATTGWWEGSATGIDTGDRFGMGRIRPSVGTIGHHYGTAANGVHIMVWCTVCTTITGHHWLVAPTVDSQRQLWGN